MAVVYITNGNPNPPHVYAVDVVTGATIGTFSMADQGDIISPQALATYNTQFVLADIGDPQNNRTDIGLWGVVEQEVFGDLGVLPGTVKFPLQYPFGSVNAEAFAVRPPSATGGGSPVMYIITKETTGGRLLALPSNLSSSGYNMCIDMNKPMPANVTDMEFTLDGKWLLIRAENVKDTIVYKAKTFAFDGYITTPTTSQGKSITMEPHGLCFLIGNSGQFSSLYRVCLPSRYVPAPPEVAFVSGSKLKDEPQRFKFSGYLPNTPLQIIINPGALTFNEITNSKGNLQFTWFPTDNGTYTIAGKQFIIGGKFTANTSVVIGSGSMIWPVPGKLTNVGVSALEEISGMQYSRSTSGFVWVHNDENDTPQVRLISLENGGQAGSYTPSGTRVDPESIRIHPDGRLFLADIGDNDEDRNVRSLYAVTEPSGGDIGTIASEKYDFQYSDGESYNAETLMIHPRTGEFIIVTKESGGGKAFSLGTGNPAGTANLIKSGLVANVSDGTFTLDGRFFLLTVAGAANVHVYSADSYTKVGTIPIPSMAKCEAITMEGPCSFLVTTEGSNAPIHRVLLPKEFGAPCVDEVDTGGGGACDDSQVPAQFLPLTNWKLTLPIAGGDGDPLEIEQPALNTYENSQYFFTLCPDKAVVFRAPPNGATTENSDNTRSELREMTADGSERIAWNSGSGTHEMRIVQAITALPSGTNTVVAGQIHDAEDDLTVLRLEGGHLFITDGRDGGSDEFVTLTNSYALGTYFEIRFIANAGGVSYYYNDFGSQGLHHVGTLPVTRSGCYFKAGCYTQASGSGVGGYGEVRIKSLTVLHS